jgi:hypothetical protein
MYTTPRYRNGIRSSYIYQSGSPALYRAVTSPIYTPTIHVYIPPPIWALHTWFCDVILDTWTERVKYQQELLTDADIQFSKLEWLYHIKLHQIWCF